MPLIMLPVLIWLALDVLHITPRPHALRIVPKSVTTAAPAQADSAAAVPAPEWVYWQKVDSRTLLWTLLCCCNIL